MRFLPFVLLSLAAAGCRGHVADYVGPRGDIVAPQLARFGLDAAQAQCVGERLGATLSPRQLRMLARRAGALRQGYFDPARLTLADLAHVAAYGDSEAGTELGRATDACGVTAAVAAAAAAEAGAGAPAAPPPPPTWLNLGAAGSGQSIAVEAASVEQAGSARTAWFRLTNPGAAASTGNSYRLRIDCAARTITPLAQRRQDAAGAITESREYGPDEGGPLAVEAGTVMEIAFLSLCT